MLINELCARYNLGSRKSLYSRLKALDIELEKDSSGRSYANPEHLELLDQLHGHLKQGGTLGNFTPALSVQAELHTARHTTQHKLESYGESISGLTTQAARHTTQLQVTPDLLGDIIERIIDRLQPGNPLQYMTDLERAAASQWILSTSEVTQLIKVKPRTKGDSKVFIRGCWCFTKCGKIGNETGWKVMKKVENVTYKV